MVPLCVGGGNRGDSADSTVTVTSSQRLGVGRFQRPRRRKGRRGQVRWGQGAGSVSMETSSMDDNESSRPINPRTNGIKKRWRVQSSTRLLLIFFPSFFFFFFLFLNAGFWVICCVFSVTILISKLEVQSHRKQKCLCLVCQDATNKK